MKKNYLVFLIFLLLPVACQEDNLQHKPALQVVIFEIDGAVAHGAFTNTGLNPEISISFNASVAPEELESALTIQGDGEDVEFDLSFTNASSKVIISPSLALATSYQLTLPAARPIGANGESLTNEFQISFSTIEEDTIRSATPCAGGPSCLSQLELSGGKSLFNFYSNYPIFEENASWENLTTAVIVIHGANRNSDDYFNWMNSTIETLGIANSTVLLAPSFKNLSEADPGVISWRNNNWREGDDAEGGFIISSFSVIDSLILQLQDTHHFPALNKIIIAGHSSGGLFTHAYGAVNLIDQENDSFEINYIVANSQYFYYPDKNRVGENTEELFTPTNCSGYDFWPLGYEFANDYVKRISREEIKDQFAERQVYYLLGNGNDPDPSFNTSSCIYNLLGSTRFQRGLNMYDYMQLTYSENHAHRQVVVQGIGHDGRGMFQSSEFIQLLNDLVIR